MPIDISPDLTVNGVLVNRTDVLSYLRINGTGLATGHTVRVVCETPDTVWEGTAVQHGSSNSFLVAELSLANGLALREKKDEKKGEKKLVVTAPVLVTVTITDPNTSDTDNDNIRVIVIS